MPNDLLILKKYEFLLDFMELRLIATLMLDKLNSGDKPIVPPVQVSAVTSEIKKMEESGLSVKNVKKYRNLPTTSRRIPNDHLERSKFNTRTKFLIEHSTRHCRYTLVLHPVGMHFDSFGKSKNEGERKYSLENKRCFVDSHKSYRGHVGRGGQGNKTFVFALLDW